jgi:hypothetical protein
MGAILITSIAAFPTTNAQLSRQQQLESDEGLASTLFQNIEDGFRIQVPEGWIIQDMNNTGSVLLEEVTQGYGILAQMCPEREEQRPLQPPPNVVSSSGGLYGSCEGAQQNIVYILRYPALDTNLQSAFGVSTNSITTDNVLLYHIQKLQEVGYRGIQIVNSTETSVNVIDAQTNQTTAIVPSKFVEMTYNTASAPNEIREGYFILTATNATQPNVGMTKGYSIFYEGTSTAAGEITSTSSSLSSSLPLALGQVFGSFELVAAPGIEQPIAQQPIVQETQAAEGTVTTTEVEIDDIGNGDGDDDASGGGGTSCHPSYPDVCIPPPPPNLNCDDVDATNFEVVPPDPHGFDGNDNDGLGCESGSNTPDEPEEEPGGGDDDDDGGDGGDDDNGGSEEPEPGPGGGDNDDGSDNGGDDDDGDDNGGDDDEGEGGGGGEGNPNEFDDCIVPPGMDPGEVGC